jgi:hypothetical protein
MKKFAKQIFLALACGFCAAAVHAANAAATRGLLDTPVYFEENHGQADSAAPFIARNRDCAMLLAPTEATLVFQKDSAPRTIRFSLIGANASAKISGLDELRGKANYFLGNDTAQWRAGASLFSRVRLDEIYPGVQLIYYPSKSAQLEYDFVVQPGADPKRIALKISGADKVRVDSDGNLVLKIGGDEVRQHKPVVYQMVNGAQKSIRASWRLTNKNTATFSIAEYDRALPLVIDPVLSFSTYLGGRYGDAGWDIATDANGNVYVCGDTFSPDLRTNFPSVNFLDYGNGATGQTNSGTTVPKRYGDAFVAKFTPTGSNTLALDYLTYLGGKGEEAAIGIAADAGGNAYVTGFTDSPNFPIWPTNAFQPQIAGRNNTAASTYRVDAFVTKISPDGQSLVYSSYLGGGERDSGNSIAVDNLGSAYVAGFTDSTNFPIVTNILGGATRVVRNKFGGVEDAFVAKVNTDGTALVYSTYLGGTNQDAATSIKVDDAGCAYVTGYTLSTNFPTMPTNNAALNGGTNRTHVLYFDAFVTKIAADGSSNIFSTFIGGENTDVGLRVALQSSNAIFITGYTYSSNFPATTLIANTRTWSNRRTNDFSDIFVTKFTQLPDGTYAYTNAGAYSVTFGGRTTDVATGLAVDSNGDAILAGYTSSTNLFNIYVPTTQVKTNHGVVSTNNVIVDTRTNILDASTVTTNKFRRSTNNVFVAVINSDASAFKFAALYGGAGNDFAHSLAFDPASLNAYVVGSTTSSNFPTVFPLDARENIKRNSNDVFVATISLASFLSPAPARRASLSALPELIITQSGGNVTLSWPDVGGNFILESNSSLAADGWAPVAQEAILSDGRYSLTIRASGASAFFRLRSP